MPADTPPLLSALLAKLDDMQLHDDTGDPADIGYQSAVDELREWARHQPAAAPPPTSRDDAGAPNLAERP